MDIRGIFYSSLRNDYLADPRKSFLFDFHLKKRLESGNDFSREPMEKLLELLAGRNGKLKLDSAGRHWLWELGERAGGKKLRMRLEGLEGAPEDVEKEDSAKRGGGKDKAQYKLILEALRGRSRLLAEDELDRLRRMVRDAAVMQDVSEFLYNAGYPLNMEKKAKPRKADRMVALMESWDAWCEERGRPSMFRQEGGGSDTLTGEEREDWEKMYRLLQAREEQAGLILPVMIDARTGVGLYLVSTSYLDLYDEDIPPRARKELDAEKKRQKYVYTCLGGSDILFQNLNYLYRRAVRRNGRAAISDLFYSFSLPLQPFEGCPPFEVALKAGEKMYEHILKDLSAFEFYREQNGIAPRGTPKRFWGYFQPEEQEDIKALAAEGRRASELDI